jgi:L-histidine N-alpha-methyltransferase
VLNRELGADFDLDTFDHVARFEKGEQWIEMRLRSRARQTVHVRGLGLTLRFEEGEDILTEISAKFRRDRMGAELAAAGLTLVAWWTDPAGDYAVSLSVR